MSYSQSWVEALKIKPEKLSVWSTQAPAGIPLLVFCLEKGHINASEYFAWASKAYGLPILRNDFFKKAFETGSLAESRNTWDPWCYPVETWEDVTIVACVEPPQERPEGNFAYVLADPVAMSEAWSRSSGDTMVKTVPRILKPVPEEPRPAPIAADGPIGVDLNQTKTFHLNLDNIGLATDHAEAVDPHAMEDSTGGENTGMTLSVMMNTAIMPLPKVPLIPDLPDTEDELATANEPPPLVPSAPPPIPRVAPISAPAASKDEKGEIARAFESIKSFYQGMMLFHCDASEARLYQWDASLKLGAKAKDPVNLATPSFFRIVARTQLPYHGYVVDSPAHREFFARFSVEALPAAVSAVPLVHDNRLIGILVAFGDENSRGAQPLECMQRAAENLTELMWQSGLKSTAA